MLTPEDVEKAIKERHQDQIAAAEMQIDNALVDYYEARYEGILVKLDPPVHRLILNELATRYRGEKKWDVEIRGDHQALVFKPWKCPVFNER